MVHLSDQENISVSFRIGIMFKIKSIYFSLLTLIMSNTKSLYFPKENK